MKPDRARLLLDRIGVLKHPCDLDLLLFFARHPRTLLASEQLVAFLGYGIKEVADSLALLLDAGLVTRTPNRTHAARLYVFAVGDVGGGWLPDLLRLASTREGRLEMIWVLRGFTSDAKDDPIARVERSSDAEPGPRPFLLRRKSGKP
jgi:hypothetical protein